MLSGKWLYWIRASGSKGKFQTNKKLPYIAYESIPDVQCNLMGVYLDISTTDFNGFFVFPSKHA